MDSMLETSYERTAYFKQAIESFGSRHEPFTDKSLFADYLQDGLFVKVEAIVNSRGEDDFCATIVTNSLIKGTSSNVQEGDFTVKIANSVKMVETCFHYLDDLLESNLYDISTMYFIPVSVAQSIQEDMHKIIFSEQIETILERAFSGESFNN